jgi:hypothetical protein
LTLPEEADPPFTQLIDAFPESHLEVLVLGHRHATAVRLTDDRFIEIRLFHASKECKKRTIYDYYVMYSLSNDIRLGKGSDRLLAV